MQNKKRILLIVPMLHQGGFERICVMTARLLQDRYDIYLAVFTKKDIFYDVSGINVIDLNLGTVDSKLGKIINIIKRIKALKHLKRKLKINISYSFGTSANIVNVLSKAQDTTWAGIRGYGAAEDSGIKLICKKADRVVSCTKVMEERFNVMFGSNSSAVLYNPCNVADIIKSSQSDIQENIKDFIEKPGKLVVSMGREDDLKGFWHLIKSIYLAKKDLTDIKLMIIGDGQYTEYKSLADKLGITNDILFTGTLNNPFSVIKNADIYALTSESEGFPNALIEAMAVGVPCISVNCLTGPAEILNEDYKKCDNQDEIYYADYGIIMPIFKGEKNLDESKFDKEEEIFSKELVKLLKDEKLLAVYKEKAIKRAKDFSTESYVEAIEKLMQQDIKGKHRI
jgi:glycosyltransferase involved in cell wall biosynthesis